MARQPITDEIRQQLKDGDPFSAFMPIRDSQGQVVVSEIQGDCNICGETVPDADSRVVCSEFPRGVHHFRGYVCCRSCQTATPMNLRVRQNGVVEWPVKGGWLKAEFDRKRFGLLAWLARFFRDD